MKFLKPSNRGLTFSLGEDEIEIGTRYRYIVDKGKNEILIIPDQQGTLKVSKKKSGNKVKPLFDIRSKEVRDIVSSSSYMEVEVRDNDIVVYTYQKAKARFRLLKGKNCTLSESLGVKTGEIIIPSAMAVGGNIYQYTLENYLESISSITSDKNTLISKSVSNELTKVYDVVSLFSGAGLFDKAWLNGRFRFVYANDNCKEVEDTYRYNIGNHFECKDIREVKSHDVPFADLYLATPPCTAFSQSNRSNVNSTVSEEIRLLVEEPIRLINDSKAPPKVVVIENVPSFLSMSDGLYLNKIIEGLSSYKITVQVVCDYKVGGYTKRRRAIIIASRIGKISLPKLDILPYKTVKDALDKVDSSWFNFNDISNPTKDTVTKMSYVPQGSNWTSIPESIYKFNKYTHSSRYLRLDPNKVGPTIANYRKLCLIHPLYNRGLSVSEASSLMGLEKDFRFFGKISDMQQMVSNGVTQCIAKIVRNTVLKALDKDYYLTLSMS